MGFDDEPDRLRGGVNGLQPEVSRLVSGGMKRGKRIIATVVAVGATVAVLSGVAYAAPWNGAGGGQGGQNGNLQVAAPPTTKPPARPKLADITPQATLQLLLDQLPDGAVTREYSGSGGRSTAPPGIIIHDKLQYVEDGVASHMAVGFSTTPSDSSNTECEDNLGEDVSCTSEDLPDGSKFVLWKYGAPDSPGVVNWFATLIRPDGVEILIIEGNAAEKEGVPPSRSAPPLSAEQLKRILTSPTWQPRLDKKYVERAERLFEPKK